MKINKRISFLVILVLGMSLFSGCATIVSRRTYKIPLEAAPGTRVTIEKNGRFFCNTTAPTTVSLRADDGYFTSARYVFTFGDPNGYDKVALEAKTDPWYAYGNIPVAFPVGIGAILGWLVVDPLTGCMWKLDEEPIRSNEYVERAQNSAHRTEASTEVPEAAPQKTESGGTESRNLPPGSGGIMKKRLWSPDK